MKQHENTQSNQPEKYIRNTSYTHNSMVFFEPFSVLFDATACGGVPITTSIIQFIRLQICMNEFVIKRRVKKFLLNNHNCVDPSVQKFLKSFGKNRNDDGKFFTCMKELLSDADKYEKSKMLDGLVALIINDRHDLSFFLKMFDMINRAHYADLKCIRCFKSDNDSIYEYNHKGIPATTLKELLNCQFLEDIGEDYGCVDESQDVEYGVKYALTEYGKELWQIYR